MAIQEKDFVELTYTGTLTETGQVFDTTDKNIAEEHHLHSKNAQYGPVTICIGQGQMLKGLEAELIGKELGEYTIKLPTEKAFGKKNAKLVVMIPTSKFTAQKIKPVPGLQVNIDGAVGTIKMVSGGRTIVDFNHPLAGKDVTYKVNVTRLLTDDKEKTEAVLQGFFGLDVTVEKKDDKFHVTFPQAIPEQLHKVLKEKVKELAGTDIQIEENKGLNKTETPKE
ncbi:peptidylprolyl isomerase [Candidatus Woesearchaeota archaeon]|nr:peptidylprolyl isomerase [Candidatus Woesearchaeota archaeon]